MLLHVRALCLLVMLGLLAGLLPGLGAGSALAQGQWQAQVVAVQDGDSLIVKRGSQRVRLRLFGVDCPEKGQPHADQAREFSRRLLGQRVTVHEMARDAHGRVVARVFGPDGQEHNLALLRAGLAWWFWRYADQMEDYGQAWWQALRAGRGLWGDARPQMPPEQWRRRQRR